MEFNIQNRINLIIYFHTDVIKISCYDYDLIGSNDLIGEVSLNVKEMGKGKIKTEWLSIFKDDLSQGELLIMYQICTIGWIPFSSQPLLSLRQIHIPEGLCRQISYMPRKGRNLDIGQTPQIQAAE